MYNYTITRLSYLPVFSILFAGGVCVGSLGGLLIVILERDAVGIMGGVFGLTAGLLSGIAGLIYTLVFNILAPLTGGLRIQLSAIESSQTAGTKISPNPEPPAS